MKSRLTLTPASRAESHPPGLREGRNRRKGYLLESKSSLRVCWMSNHEGKD